MISSAAAGSFGCLLAIVALAAQPSPTSRPPAPEGTWGGVGLRVEFVASGARLELDAAHGTIGEAIALDAGGRFEVAGTYVRERPGPTRVGGEDEGAEPARYRGTITGDTLTLEITLTRSGKAIGPLQARRGANARLRKMV